ncbi:MAG: sulfate adenylyltransferase subunit CysN [Gammaproteobacteria bacterium]|nr:sulfate adenylyltransferase subunit CysN [Gammaproteobacteria bacterium]
MAASKTAQKGSQHVAKTSATNASAQTIQQKVDEYIETQSHLDLLRFITCGSVDDGKSTLIGRMLYEAQMIFEDQVTSLRNDSKKMGTQGGEIDFALLVDGLAAEREQGITIDVAYRFFNTDHRKFIVADTPGHEQYTRNMVTGASTADVAVILLDATQGVLTQTRRHSFIASLLGIKHVVLAVNKMDLANFDKKTYDDIVEEYRAFSRDLSFETITEIPMSALKGDNVIQRSSQTTWYTGPTLLGFLETVEVGRSQLDHPFRFPVQWVNRPSHEFRGYTGTIVAGQVEKGQAVRVLPSGEMANVDEIILYKTKLDKAVADQAVTITLDREVDISRGDVIVAADEPCQASDQFEVSLVWMDQEEGFIGRNYWMIIGTTKVNATIRDIKFKYNINTFEHISSQSLALNEISEVTLSVDKDVPYEAYQSCKAMGAFVLIDRYSHATVGAGMINFALRRAENVHRQALEIDKKARAKLNGHPGRALWFTGLSGSGKSTVANALEQALHEKGLHTYILDGDNVRHGLNRDLGFTDADRIENVRRVAEVTKLMVDAGIVVITSFISPFRSERQMARELFDAGEFIEVYVNVTLDQAEKRDPKGLYKKARRGELPNFTGIDSAYEEPEIPEIELKTGEQSVEECVEQILKFL